MILRTPLRLLAEALRSVMSQKVISTVTIFVIAGMCAAILLTNGRAAGASRAVLASIDAEGVRTITVRADPSAGVTLALIDRLSSLSDVSWSVGFGPARDATNAAFTGGTRVPVRTMFASSGAPISTPDIDAFGSGVYVSDVALADLGMQVPAGALLSEEGATFDVMGRISVGEALQVAEPVAVRPVSADLLDTESLTLAVIVARNTTAITPLANAIRGVVAADDASKVQIETSSRLAEIRNSVSAQLNGFSQTIVVGVVAITVLLVGAMLAGFMLIRRKDFGRRRALGASRGLILALVLTQTGLLAAVGALLGCVGSAVVLISSNDPLPSAIYFTGVLVLAVAAGVLAALLPAIGAASRDPIKELRVP